MNLYLQNSLESSEKNTGFGREKEKEYVDIERYK